jgi:NitT/TauT family transport system permease protein
MSSKSELGSGIVNRRWARPGTRSVLLAILSITLVAVAWLVAQPYTRYLPPVASMVEQIGALLSTPEELLSIVGTTFGRLVIGLFLGYSIAVLVALLMRRSQWWSGVLGPYLVVAASTPSLVAALMAVMVFGFSDTGVYLATAIVLFPYVVFMLTEGFEGLDSGLADMASVHRFSRRQYYMHVAFPELMPYLFAAFRNAHALAWKIVVLVEVFGRTTGIGYQYQRAYGLFDLPLLMTWLLFFLAIVWLVEYGVLQPIGKRLFRWRLGV